MTTEVSQDLTAVGGAELETQQRTGDEDETGQWEVAGSSLNLKNKAQAVRI